MSNLFCFIGIKTETEGVGEQVAEEAVRIQEIGSNSRME
jgi:hypothetical protein